MDGIKLSASSASTEQVQPSLEKGAEEVQFPSEVYSSTMPPEMEAPHLTSVVPLN